MSSGLTDRMRRKYAPRPYGEHAIFNRMPPGGADVHQLCDAVDRLQSLVELLNGEATEDSKKNAQRVLWEVLL